jgi:hypothetical protein
LHRCRGSADARRDPLTRPAAARRSVASTSGGPSPTSPHIAQVIDDGWCPSRVGHHALGVLYAIRRRGLAGTELCRSVRRTCARRNPRSRRRFSRLSATFSRRTLARSYAMFARAGPRSRRRPASSAFSARRRLSASPPFSRPPDTLTADQSDIIDRTIGLLHVHPHRKQSPRTNLLSQLAQLVSVRLRRRLPVTALTAAAVGANWTTAHAASAIVR